MQYLAYQEYLDMGGVLDATAFNRNIDRACGIIDNAVHCRIDSMAEVPWQAKALCRDLIEYFEVNTVTEATVTGRSQSSGPVSESESYAVKSKEEQALDIDNMLYDYLMSVTDDKGTPLLYRGCSS